MRRGRRLDIAELAPYLLETPAEPMALNFAEVFGNNNPLEIEVGFGKGLFLVTAAPARLDVNFLGVEISRKYQLFTATRLTKIGLHNVRLAKADAREFLRDFVAEASCQALHVYFPDPWWKKRHLKRRVFTPEFAVQCERVLRQGGRIHVVTDVEEYFGVMRGLLNEKTRLGPVSSEEIACSAREGGVQTNFERKFRMEGRTIYRVTYAKGL